MKGKHRIGLDRAGQDRGNDEQREGKGLRKADKNGDEKMGEKRVK